MTFVLQK